MSAAASTTTKRKQDEVVSPTTAEAEGAAASKQLKATPTGADSKAGGGGGVPAVDPSTHPAPMHFRQWISDNKNAFQPPVGNKLINGRGCQFKVMVVGGPNTRTDYHINRGEEWFYMVKGDMILKVVDGGRFRDIVIREGEAFCLPAQIPHSPQRYADSYGLVLEHDRHDGELDGLRWYCRTCSTAPQTITTVYETFFVCEDLGSQLKERINAYYGDEKQRTCQKCKTVDQKVPILAVEQALAQAEINNKVFASQQPDPNVVSINPITHPNPFKVQPKFDALTAAVGATDSITPLAAFEWKAYAVRYAPDDSAKSNGSGGGSGSDAIALHTASCEEWVWQWTGAVSFCILDGGVLRSITVKEGEIYLIPRGVPRSLPRAAGGAATGVFVTLARVGTKEVIALYDRAHPQSAPKHQTEFTVSADPLKEIKHHTDEILKKQG